jgi:hypothetical protein
MSHRLSGTGLVIGAARIIATGASTVNATTV